MLFRLQSLNITDFEEIGGVKGCGGGGEIGGEIGLATVCTRNPIGIRTFIIRGGGVEKGWSTDIHALCNIISTSWT